MPQFEGAECVSCFVTTRIAHCGISSRPASHAVRQAIEFLVLPSIGHQASSDKLLHTDSHISIY